MTERPILFSGEMVRAILAGRKTQTRRKMKVQPWPDSTVEVGPYHPHIVDRHGESHPGPATFGAVWDHQNVVNGGNAHLRCPYGAPGDLLWVRETCWAESTFDSDGVRYAADHAWRIIENTQEASEAWCKLAQYGGDDALDNQTNIGRLVPSIHMPRWASRITLEVKSVRVERLQDISEDDARAEGCEARPFPGPWWQGYQDLGDGQMLHQQAVGETPPDWMIEPKKMPPTPWLDLSAQDGFRSIWMGLHGPDAWEANPWVWVIEFERVKP